MNMRIILTIAEPSEKFACGIVSKPAVRVVTDWKKAAIAFCAGFKLPSEDALFQSSARIRSAPPNRRMTVVVRTSLVWSVKPRTKFFRVRFPFTRSCTRSRTSHQTGKPRPLKKIRPIVVKLMRGFVTNGANEDSPTRSIPALQKADTEWNRL